VKTVTGLTPAREQQLVERLVLSQERAMQPAMAREIKRAMKSMSAATTSGAAKSALAAHKARVAAILDKQYRSSFKVFGSRIFEGAAKVQKAVPSTAQFTAMANEWIKKNGAKRVIEIAGTTQEQTAAIVNAATSQGILDGMSEIAIAKEIQNEVASQALTMSSYRSRVIARTETGTAAKVATDQGALASGLPMMKEWVASGGERTRETHRSANGQRVRMSQPFDVGGSALMYPQDPNGPAVEVINCRCVAAYIVI